MFMSLLIQYLCRCVYAKGRVRACAISWEMSTKALNLGCKLIKAPEQMVQAWSGRNETVNGETNRTWQDSCEGFERWPAVRHLPGASLQSRERNRSGAETFEPLFRRHLYQLVFTSYNRVRSFYGKWIMPVFFVVLTICLSTPVLNHSIWAGGFW